MDDNHNGYITFNEFITLMCSLTDKKKCTGILKSIRKYDYLNILAERGPIKVPMSPTIYKAKLIKQKERAELLKRIAKKKRQDEKNKKSSGKRRGNYAVSDEESKGYDSINENNESIDRFVSSNYDDEELDELRALAPPEVSTCFTFVQMCSCCCIDYVESVMDTLNISRTKGPHGMFCLCGCRGCDAKRYDMGF